MLSIDGVGAYDHVHRSAMLSKLLEVPSLQPLLPFVRAAYTEPTRYTSGKMMKGTVMTLNSTKAESKAIL